MILYHGSYLEIQTPDLVHSRENLYFENLIDKYETIRRLRYEKPNLQICLRSQKVLKEYLHYEGSEQI